jgi:hydrogenase maturation protease
LSEAASTADAPATQAAAARPRIVVFGWGNTSRGDDAIGPLLLADLEAAQLPGVETIEDFQLQIEHTLDMVGADLLLFLDAGTQTAAPYVFYEAKPAGTFTASTHALLPEALLSVYQQVHGHPPPPAFVLCVRGEQFGLGEPMSEVAIERLEAAKGLVRELCAKPEVEGWRERLLP